MSSASRPSLQQEPLWFLQELDPASSAYHVAFALELEGALDEAALERALRDVVAAQDCLQLAMPSRLGRAVLTRAPLARLPFERASVEAAPDPAAERARRLDELVHRPFRLSEAPLFRVLLLREGKARHTLGCVFHHVIFDGVSVELFSDALLRAYRARAAGEASPLEAPGAPFSRFVDRQRAWVKSERGAAAKAYWRERLEGAPVLELPTDRPRRSSGSGAASSGSGAASSGSGAASSGSGAASSGSGAASSGSGAASSGSGAASSGSGAASLESRGATRRRMLPHDIGPRIEAFARARGLTPFMVLLATFEALLARHAGVNDVSVGTPISLRMSPAVRKRIGLFVNTAVIRARLEDDPSFEGWVERVKEACMGAFRHHELPFAKVVEAVSPERAEGQNPLFSVMFILQSSPVLPDVPGLRVTHRELAPRASKFDLTGAVAVGEDGYELSLEYDTALFSAATVDRIAGRFERLLEGALARPETPLSELPLLTTEEAERLERWSAGRPFPEGLSTAPLPEQIARLAAEDPERLVLEEGGRGLTRGALVARAARACGGLAARGVGPGDRVGIALDPGAELLVAALAVWQTGAAYVPLDGDLPRARIAALVEDAGVGILIRGEREVGAARDEVRLEALEAAEPIAPRTLAGEDLAYVIYTSGSTGRPKGVEVVHEGLARSVGAFCTDLALPAGAKWTALATFSFDISVIELYGPVLFDGVAVVPPREVTRDGPALARWLDAVRPELLQTTPTRWRMLLAAGWVGHGGLVALSGGEVLTVGLARELLMRADRLANIYGPTECTVWASFHEVLRSEIEGCSAEAALPVGPAIPGMRLHVLDAAGHRAPIGVPGEIQLAGPQLARGYLRRPEQTAAAFSARPHVGETRAYATGDRAWLDGQGTLRLLGRADDQVKIRGHRIELGEVEAAARALPEVEEAAVVKRANARGEAALFAFASPAEGRTPTVRGLREALAEVLPLYMVPEVITLLEELPRTPSGKIDRKRLPDASPQEASPAGDVATDLLELQMTKIWEDVLGHRPVRVDDDFFALGGQSVLAVELAARLEAALEHPVSVMDVFRARTVGGLADRVRQGGVELPWRTIVAHRPEGQRPALFTIGAGQMMQGLLHHLDPEVPLFSLNIFGLVPDAGDIPRLGVKDIAAAFVEDMKRAAPTGPYQLLGYCADTKVALEVARQLEAWGDEVSFFGTIDVIGDPADTRWELRQALGLLRDYGWAYPKGLLERRRRHHRLALMRLSARLASLVDRVVLRELTKRERHDIFYARYLEALAAYSAQPFSGEVSFFICSEYYRRTSERALRELAQGRARVFEVPGFHETLFDPPWVETLGEQLSRALG